jgi:hypothetical protein
LNPLGHARIKGQGFGGIGKAQTVRRPGNQGFHQEGPGPRFDGNEAGFDFITAPAVQRLGKIPQRSAPEIKGNFLFSHGKGVTALGNPVIFFQRGRKKTVRLGNLFDNKTPLLFRGFPGSGAAQHRLVGRPDYAVVKGVLKRVEKTGTFPEGGKPASHILPVGFFRLQGFYMRLSPVPGDPLDPHKVFDKLFCIEPASYSRDINIGHSSPV